MAKTLSTEVNGRMQKISTYSDPQEVMVRNQYIICKKKKKVNPFQLNELN